MARSPGPGCGLQRPHTGPEVDPPRAGQPAGAASCPLGPPTGSPLVAVHLIGSAAPPAVRRYASASSCSNAAFSDVRRADFMLFSLEVAEGDTGGEKSEEALTAPSFEVGFDEAVAEVATLYDAWLLTSAAIEEKWSKRDPV